MHPGGKHPPLGWSTVLPAHWVQRLGRRVTEIALVFKRAPHQPFGDAVASELGQNAVVIRVQPDEGVLMRFGSKVPGPPWKFATSTWTFPTLRLLPRNHPKRTNASFWDVLLGESSLFPTNEEVELSWKILDPILEYWADHGRPDDYEAGTWGPASADKMLGRQGRTWRRP